MLFVSTAIDLLCSCPSGFSVEFGVNFRIDKDECDFKVIFVLLFFWNFIAHVDSTHIVLLNAKKSK